VAALFAQALELARAPRRPPEQRDDLVAAGKVTRMLARKAKEGLEKRR